jgi:hypothetical protein
VLFHVDSRPVNSGVRSLLSMRYYLLSKGEFIGFSELEGRDVSMGIASGRFYPGDNYFKVKHIFLKRPELLSEVASLELSVETQYGERVGTERISLDDFSDEIDEYLLSVVVDTRETYERFFL